MAVYELPLGAASHKDNIVPTTSAAISLHYWSDWGSFVTEFFLIQGLPLHLHLVSASIFLSMALALKYS